MVVSLPGSVSSEEGEIVYLPNVVSKQLEPETEIRKHTVHTCYTVD